MNGKLIIIVGPSASGKTELVKALLKKVPHSIRLKTTTTRERRPGEEDDYFFIRRNEFEKKIQEGDFFEYAEVYGNLYGLSKTHLDEYRKSYDYVFALIDVKGAKTLKSKIPDALTIFIKPDSIEIMKRRIIKVRGNTLSPEELQKRLDTAMHEINLASTFDIVVENKEGYFTDTISEIMSIF